MKTEQLQYFIDLLDTGSLSKTAENFYTSHQVVKKAIKNLEDELNVKLIETSNQGTTLTDGGKILQPYAKHLLQTTKALKVELEPLVQKSSCSKRKKIQFCITPYLTDSLILQFINEYQNKHLDVDIELVSLPFSDMLTQVDSPKSIFIIPTTEMAMREKSFLADLEKNNLQYFILTEVPIYFCTYEKSKWTEKQFQNLEDFKDVPILISNSNTLNMSLVNQSNCQIINSFDAQKRLIKMGKGLGIFTKKEFEYYYKNTTKYILLPIELGNVQYICVRKKEVEMPEYIQLFLDELKTCF